MGLGAHFSQYRRSAGILLVHLAASKRLDPAGERLTTRWSGRVIDKVQIAIAGVRAAQLSR